MEFTVEVRREENHCYSAEITRADLPQLQDAITEARTLRELPAYLEDLVQIMLEDRSVRLVDPRLEVGTIRVSLQRG